MIEIKNMRVEKPSQPWDIRVDRTSVLGNPFHMKSENERDLVCDKYKSWFKEALRKDEKVRKELQRLLHLYLEHKKLNLYCWCAPKRCHAESIRETMLFMMINAIGKMERN